MRTWDHISEQNDLWLEETAGNKSKLKEYFNCEFKPIAIKAGKGSEPVMKTFPPDPLHCNLLGPCNDAIEKMESLWGDVMLEFYRRHALKKSGQSGGGKFNGVDIRLIIKESSLQELATMLPVEAEPFLNYFRSIKELHSAVVLKEYSYSRCEKSVFDYEVNFWHLHAQFSLPMTLKVHVILDHYMWYFKEMGTNFHDTNGDYVEAVHYSLEGHENKRKYMVSRKIGTDEHLRKAISSHTSFNSLRVGSPLRIMSIRKKQSNSPLAIHNK